MIGALPVQAIGTAVVMKILEPIWTAKPETAGRIRGRIESILDWATVRQFRSGDNPARWNGHLDQLLPRKGEIDKVRHQPAMPYPAVPGFMAELREHTSTSARALEFTVLATFGPARRLAPRGRRSTCAAKIWTIPADASRPNATTVSRCRIARSRSWISATRGRQRPPVHRGAEG